MAKVTKYSKRTRMDVRSILSKNGGSLAEPGAVSWQFERKGVILVPSSVEEDEVMLVALDAGAEVVVAGPEGGGVVVERVVGHLVGFES